MSVLNQMLRDLDARQAVPPQVTPLLGSPVVAQRDAKARLVWRLAGLLVLFALADWFYQRIDSAKLPESAAAQQTAVTGPAALSPSAASVAAAVADSPPPAPAPSGAQPLTVAAAAIPAAAALPEVAPTAPEHTAWVVTANNAIPASMQAAQPALSNALAAPAPAQPAVSAGGQLSIEPVDAAVSIAQPARAPEQHSSGMALAVQLQQLRQWQLAKNWSAVLAAVTPALRQQYPQQVLALEAYAASQQGDQPRALQAAQLWARHSPMDGRALLAQAIALDQLGQLAPARELYLRALQLGGLSVASQQYIRQRLAGGG